MTRVSTTHWMIKVERTAVIIIDVIIDYNHLCVLIKALSVLTDDAGWLNTCLVTDQRTPSACVVLCSWVVQIRIMLYLLQDFKFIWLSCIMINASKASAFLNNVMFYDALIDHITPVMTIETFLYCLFSSPSYHRVVEELKISISSRCLEFTWKSFVEKHQKMSLSAILSRLHIYYILYPVVSKSP